MLKDIAKYINKSYDTVRGWRKRQPQLLELLEIGYFCKVNNLTKADILGFKALKEDILSKS